MEKKIKLPLHIYNFYNHLWILMIDNINSICNHSRKKMIRQCQCQNNNKYKTMLGLSVLKIILNKK